MPLNGQCQSQDISYKCTVSTSIKPDKRYLGTAEGDAKKRYYNRTKFFRDKRYTNDTSPSKYIWEVKENHQENLSLKWSIVKRVLSYSKITKTMFLLSSTLKNYQINALN